MIVGNVAKTIELLSSEFGSVYMPLAKHSKTLELTEHGSIEGDAPAFSKIIEQYNELAKLVNLYSEILQREVVYLGNAAEEIKKADEAYAGE